MSDLDPATHLDELPGRLLERVRGLTVGGRVAMPDGTTVQATRSSGRSERVFVVRSGLTPPSRHRGAQDAVAEALNASARTSHSSAIGGVKSYPDFHTFLKRNT
jgi:hypothetical protein